jgi:hypothetical protein
MSCVETSDSVVPSGVYMPMPFSGRSNVPQLLSNFREQKVQSLHPSIRVDRASAATAYALHEHYFFAQSGGKVLLKQHPRL